MKSSTLINDVFAFINANFDSDLIFRDSFNPGVLEFIYLRCLKDDKWQVALEITSEYVGLSKVKVVSDELDFSRNDEVYEDIVTLKSALLKIKDSGLFQV